MVGCHAGYRRSNGCLCYNWTTDSRYLLMAVLASMLIGGFIFWAAFLTDDNQDDDDGPGDGMLTPVYAPN